MNGQNRIRAHRFHSHGPGTGFVKSQQYLFHDSVNMSAMLVS
jgi:hypothetical protein